MTRPIFLVTTARLASVFMGIALLALLGRRLGPGGFGSFQLALAVMVYPALLVDLGLTTLGLREIAAGRPATTVIGTIVSARLSLATAVTIVVGGAIIALPLDDATRWTFAVLVLGLPASALSARWVLQGRQRFGAAASVEVLTSATQLALAALLVSGSADVVRAAAAVTLAAWATTIVSIVVAGSWRSFAPAFRQSVARTILRSLPLGAAAIAITIYYSIDTVMLGLFRGPVEVAWYAAAYRIILPILGLAAAVGTVAVPRLTALAAAGPTGGATMSDVASLTHRMILVATPLACGGALIADSLIRLVYGAAFASAADPFRILVWSVLTVYANSAFAFLLLATRQDRRYLAATGTGAVINVGLNLVAIPAAGMIGAAIVTIASELVVLALIVRWTSTQALDALRRAAAAVLFPTVAMAAAVWPVRESLAAIPIGAVVYGLAVVATERRRSRKAPGRRREAP